MRLTIRKRPLDDRRQWVVYGNLGAAYFPTWKRAMQYAAAFLRAYQAEWS
ncbi:MAG: hypothetical protein ABFD89_28835 [Bryobacteraceae bacterium]